MSLISACDGSDRSKPLEQVDTIVIPEADTTTRTNFNIDDPTLSIPETFPVSDLDLLTLVWSDEFDGAQLDPEVWFFESGDGSQYGIPGWGNNERQWYLPDNARLEDGKLKIEARRETVGNFGYTSARINTRDRFAFKYGRIEASIKLPSGQGLWPAFWMLAQDSPYGDWPSSGEIDILEAVNLDGFPGPGGTGGGNEIFGTLHYGGGNLGRIIASNTYVPSTDVTSDFRTYAVEWDETEIRWYYDGILYAVENSWQSDAAPYPAPFDQPFYILLNLAVGGDFPGPPDGSTPFPATMEVDWVRVYSGEESEPVVEPTDPGIIPEAGVYASDPDTMNEDLAPPGGIQDFGSGAVIADDFSDPTFTRVLRVTSGDAYDPGNVEVGFAAFTGYAAGFAADYETLHFKVKGDPSNLATFEVKFFVEGDGGAADNGQVLDITNYAGADVLGNGWYQVSVPISDFSSLIDSNDGFLLGPAGDQGERFSFLMTDIGFSAEGDTGGGTGLGIYSETYTETAVTITNIVSAGNTVTIEDSTAVPPFEGLVSLSLTYSDNSEGQGFGGAIFEFEDEDVSAYDTLKFSIDTSAFTGFANLTVQFEPPGGGTEGGNVSLASYTPVATSGNWRTYEIPLADFTAVDTALVNKLGFFNARDDGDVLLAGTLYLDDIYLTTTDGNGGGGGGGEGDIAVNGGFETGDLSGWTLFPASADPDEQTVVTTNPREGTYAGRLNNTTPGTASLIKQANLTPVSIGQTATVSFSARGSCGVGGVAFAEFFTEVEGEGTSSNEILGGGPLVLDADPEAWTDFEFTVPITADVSGGVTLQLTATTGGDGSFADVYYDNVSIVIN
ncbi:MAG: family 16 glycosylhydrolase [Gammaproteobacteria bacterium]